MAPTKQQHYILTLNNCTYVHSGFNWSLPKMLRQDVVEFLHNFTFTFIFCIFTASLNSRGKHKVLFSASQLFLHQHSCKICVFIFPQLTVILVKTSEYTNYDESLFNDVIIIFKIQMLYELFIYFLQHTFFCKKFGDEVQQDRNFYFCLLPMAKGEW